MNIDTVSFDQLQRENRMDPGYFLHPARDRHWSVPTRPLSDVADIARNDRLEDHTGSDPVIDTDKPPQTIDPIIRRRETDERTYLQWVQPGDVLLHRARKNFCVYVAQECLASFDFWVIRTDEELHPPFLALCLRSTYIQEEINRRSTGHVRNRIPKNELEQLPLPVPDVDRQSELIDRYRDRVGEVDQQKDLKTLVDRLSDLLGFTETTTAPVRIVPADALEDRMDPPSYFSTSYRYEGDADQVPLETVADVENIERPRTDPEDTDHVPDPDRPRIRGQDLNNLLIQPDTSDRYRSRGGRSNGIRIPPGAILLDRYVRDRLQVGYVLREDGVIVRANLYQIEVVESKVDPVFLAGYLSTRAAAEQLLHRTSSTRSNRTRIGLDTLRELSVPLPDRDRQNDLVKELRATHRRRQTLADGPPPENELLRTLIED